MTIVDNIVRAIPEMTRLALELKGQPRTRLEAIVRSYDNKKVLEESLKFMSARLAQLAKSH